MSAWPIFRVLLVRWMRQKRPFFVMQCMILVIVCICGWHVRSYRVLNLETNLIGFGNHKVLMLVDCSTIDWLFTIKVSARAWIGLCSSDFATCTPNLSAKRGKKKVTEEKSIFWVFGEYFLGLRYLFFGLILLLHETSPNFLARCFEKCRVLPFFPCDVGRMCVTWKKYTWVTENCAFYDMMHFEC